MHSQHQKDPPGWPVSVQCGQGDLRSQVGGIPVENGGIGRTCAGVVYAPKPEFGQAQLGGNRLWVVQELLLKQLQGLVTVTDKLLEPGHRRHKSVAGRILSVGSPVVLEGVPPSVCPFVLESCGDEVVHAGMAAVEVRLRGLSLD